MGYPFLSSAAPVAAQQTTIFQLVLGIVTGIVTAFVLWSVKHLWETWLRPRIERFLYNGLSISGDWYAFDIDDELGTTMLYSLRLEQSAWKLYGTGEIRYASVPNSYVMQVDITGELWEGYLSLTVRPAQRHTTAFSAGLYKVTEAGTRLSGYLNFRDKTEDRVVSFENSFEKGLAPTVVRIAFDSAVQRIDQKRAEVSKMSDPNGKE